MSDNTKQLHTVNAFVGKKLFECFFSDTTFNEVKDTTNTTFTEEHSHVCYELLICKKGSGFQFVDNVAHEYKAGSIFVFAPFVTHAHISNVDYPEIRCSIRFELSKKQAFDTNTKNIVTSALKQINEQGFYSFESDKNFDRVLNALIDTVSSEDQYSDITVGGYLSSILSIVIYDISIKAGKNSASFPKSWNNIDNPDQRRFIIDYYFDQLCNNNARMEDLCEQVHLSPNQLNRIIKEMFGTTYKQKLIEVRIAYIKYFLKYSDMTISQIAEKSNFLESSNLSLFFKQHCGETPSQYRSRVRNTSNLE